MKLSVAIGLVATMIWTVLSLLFSGTVVWWQIIGFVALAMLAEFVVGPRHRRRK